MSCRVWINPAPALLERLLPGARGSGLVPLWILPDQKRFSAEALKAVIESVVGLQCAIWNLCAADAFPLAERSKYGAFLRYPKLIDGFLAQSEIRYSDRIKSLEFRNSTRLYADIAWLALGQWELLSEFFAASWFGKDAAIAFLPQATAEAQRWANFAVGYLWHALNYRFTSDGATPLLPSNAILLAIIRLTANIGGIATTICCDSEMRKAMVLWGTEKRIRGVATRLERTLSTGDETSFAKWSGRGVAFVF